MSDPQELVEAALAASASDGCIAIATAHSETNLRFAANALTTNGQASSRSLTVIATADRADGTGAGVVTRTVASVEEVEDLVRAADADAREAPPAEDAAPIVGDYPHDDDWSADAQATSVEVFAHAAEQLASTFESWRKADLRLYGFAEHMMTSTFLGTSAGLRRRFDQPDGRLELNGKSGDGSSWQGVHTVDFRGVDVDELTQELERRLGWAQRRVDLEPGRYETILPPSAVADLMIYTYWNASARDAEEGRNVFGGSGSGTRIGERLATLPLNMRSDPAAAGLACAPFEVASSSSAGLRSVFDNGQPVEPASWITDGTLTDLVRTRAWAGRTEGEARPLVGNLLLDGGSGASVDEMVARTERGLLLTCLWYIREVDPQTLLLTGLTRDGVYLVEDGAVRAAVNNFRFNESPVDLLSRAVEAGASVPTLSREWNDYFRRTVMPALRVPDFNMSTVSQAS